MREREGASEREMYMNMDTHIHTEDITAASCKSNYCAKVPSWRGGWEREIDISIDGGR